MSIIDLLFPPLPSNPELYFIKDPGMLTEITDEYRRMGLDEGWLEFHDYAIVGNTIEYYYRLI